MLRYWPFLLAVFALPTLAADRPVLTVYTYNSFTADWGPGPAIQQAFEAECGCELRYVALDSGGALLGRLQLEGARSSADVVLGLDTNLMAEAAATGLFAPHGMTLEALTLPIDWDDPLFVPFDYGYFAFVHDTTRLPDPPDSFAALLDAPDDLRIIIQDPRTSTPGLGLLLWIKKVYGDDAATVWERLQPRILTVTRGWSEAYGLFLQGEAPLVLSYTTSPAYHAIAENDPRYAAAAFAEGHYLQVEVAGRLASAAEPELAEQFLAFMVSTGFQQHIPTGNWMYPVIALDLPEGFNALIEVDRALLFDPETVRANRRAWVDEWLEVLSR